MITFPDTSFLCSLYRQQVHSPRVIAYLHARPGALDVSSLLLLEFRQSVRLQVRLNLKDKTKGYSHQEGAAMLRALQSDLATGEVNTVPADWSDVYRIAEGLSGRYTQQKGHRLADILHVATALHWGAAEFLTFDANQKLLAEAEGMNIAF